MTAMTNIRILLKFRVVEAGLWSDGFGELSRNSLFLPSQPCKFKSVEVRGNREMAASILP